MGKNYLRAAQRAARLTAEERSARALMRDRVASIVRRDCHVAASHLEALRHVIGRLKDGRATYWRLPQHVRHGIQLGVAAGRKDNIRLYQFVQRGF